MLSYKDIQTGIDPWKRFAISVRTTDCSLLKRLDDFSDSILVTGCQRSGTTMLTKVIIESSEIVRYEASDENWMEAFILSGYVDYVPQGRYCFQTTYLNGYHEYFDHPEGHKILWVLRNPYSVVYSMLYNWANWALDELFRQCGVSLLTGTEKRLYRLLGMPGISGLQRAYFAYSGRGARFLMRHRFDPEKLMLVDYDDSVEWRGISRLRRACFGYSGKVSQLSELRQQFGPEQLMVVEYDDLVLNKETLVPEIYKFMQLEYRPQYADRIHSNGIDKRKQLSEHEVRTIQSLCEPVYTRARQYVSTV